MATLWVEEISQSTDEVGYFFYSLLSPGKHKFQVQNFNETFMHSQIFKIHPDQSISVDIIQIES